MYCTMITIFARKPKLGEVCKPGCRKASGTPASPEAPSGQGAFKPVCAGEREQGVHCWGARHLRVLLCSRAAQPSHVCLHGLAGGVGVYFYIYVCAYTFNRLGT